MKNYKINIDKPKPTQEEILAGRNFDQVLKQYNASPGKVIKKPFWKSAGFIGSVAAVAATVAIVIMVMKGNNNPVTNQPQDPGMANNIPANNSGTENNGTENAVAWTPTKRVVAPPLAGVDVPFKEYKVSSSKGGTISYPTGTKIKFQPNSFVDANGAPVSGNVEVQYREMHDAVDFFVSGIPMAYDSGGSTYQFESAGMMEIAAFVNGQVVYLDKNKPMQVDMASNTPGTDFNLYMFNKEAGNWEYQGKDAVKEMPYTKDQRMRDSLEMLKWWLESMRAGFANHPGCGGSLQGPLVDGIRPVKADPSKNRFIVDFNKEEFPEMANYEKVIFEVDESKEKFDKANYEITWDLVKLTRGDASSRYKLNLTKGLKKVSLDVYPVLDGEEYSKAFAAYTAQHDAYIKDSTARANWKPAINPNNNQINNNLNPVVNANVNPSMTDAELAKQFKFDPEAYKRMKAQRATDAVVNDMQRTFTASGFGIYNCDRPDRLPAGSVVDMELRMEDGTPFTDVHTMYHVDRERNTLMSYYGGSTIAQFHCDTRSSNLGWVVKDGELYYAENDAFEALPVAGKCAITLKKVAKKLNTADDIRAFFHIKAPESK